MTEDSITIEFYGRDCTLKKKIKAKKKSLTHLLYVERNCFSNCVKNLFPMEALAGCQLRITAGSLGMCTPSPVWYEWGGTGDSVFHTVQQFRKCQFTGLPSVHFWLESELDGKIWDVLDVLYLVEKAAPLLKKTIDTSTFVHGCLIAGRTREELEACGLKYVPADPMVQEILEKKHVLSTEFKTLKD